MHSLFPFVLQELDDATFVAVIRSLADCELLAAPESEIEALKLDTRRRLALQKFPPLPLVEAA